VYSTVDSGLTVTSLQHCCELNVYRLGLYVATELHVARFSCRVGLAWASLLENLACHGLHNRLAYNPRKFWLCCMSVHVGYSVRSACISSDKVSNVEHTTVEVGNIDAVVWCSARSLVCLSVWSSSTDGGRSPWDLNA